MKKIKINTKFYFESRFKSDLKVRGRFKITKSDRSLIMDYEHRINLDYYFFYN